MSLKGRIRLFISWVGQWKAFCLFHLHISPFPVSPNKSLSLDKQGIGLQGIFGKTAVPQPPCCLSVPGWMWDSSLLRKSQVPSSSQGFIVYRAHYYVTMKQSSLGFMPFLSFLNSNNCKGEEILRAALCFQRKKNEVRKGCWAGTHMSLRMEPVAAALWMYPGFRAWICARKAFSDVGDGTRSSKWVRPNSESTLLSVSLPTSVKQKTSHLTFTKVCLPISLSILLPFQLNMPPSHSESIILFYLYQQSLQFSSCGGTKYWGFCLSQLLGRIF